MEFHLGGKRAVAPRGHLRIERGDQRVRRDAHRRRRGVKEPEIARVRGVDLPSGEALRRDRNRFRRIDDAFKCERRQECSDGGGIEFRRDGEAEPFTFSRYCSILVISADQSRSRPAALSFRDVVVIRDGFTIP
jgi:hypothetical protein